MQKVTKLLLLGLIVSVSMIGTGFAFAATDAENGAAQSGLDSGLSLKVSGLSVLPGILLSLFSVWNKNITGSGSGTSGKEVVDPRKLAINIILGIVIGLALNIIGLSTDSIKAQSPFLVAVAVTATNYMFLHLSNLSMRPIFGHLVRMVGTVKAADPTQDAAQNKGP